MTETIVFSLPTPGPNEDPAYEMLWYQSLDGISWDITPVDIVLVSILTHSPNGQYIWTSSLANPNRYHKLKSRSQLGVESFSSIILPPRALMAAPTITGISLNNFAVYYLGDSIELMLQVDQDKISLLGDQTAVDVVDFTGNTIVTLVANRIGDIFVAEWTIPLGLKQFYNVTKQSEPGSTEYFYLSDRWMLNGSTMKFDFLVEKNIEEAIQNNCEYNITVKGALSADNNMAEDFVLKFSSQLNPYYSSVDEVKNVLFEELSAVDDFIIARDIHITSQQVDLHLRPNTIYRQDQYDLAVRMYVKYYIARQHLIFLLNINAESKELDMLKYSRQSGNPERALDNVDALITKYSYIILAGGKDTPFIPKTFTKGILDPNRVSANRAGLDVSDPYPWVNSSTANSVIPDGNGGLVELRGTRTVSFLKNRVSFPNVYLRSEGVS